MHRKCINCSTYKTCVSPNVIHYGKLICEKEEASESGCSQCGEPLVLGHVVLDKVWWQFWCEECFREYYEEKISEEEKK